MVWVDASGLGEQIGKPFPVRIGDRIGCQQVQTNITPPVRSDDPVARGVAVVSAQPAGALNYQVHRG